VRIMKWEIITILLIITAVLLTGCTGQDKPAPPAAVQQTITPGSMPHGTAAVTTLRQPVTSVQITATENPVKIFNGDYHWVEYREISSVTMPPNPRSSWIYSHRLERSTENYQGRPAVHFKTTTISDYPECCINDIVTITKDGSVYVEDTWFDTSTGRCLGGTLSGTIRGIAQPQEVMPEDNSLIETGSYGGWMGIMPFREVNMTLTDWGTESMTVPAGTYTDAWKLTGKFPDGTPITFWVVPGVPVPVRYEFSNKYLDGEDPLEVFELKGWG
jgi:hypothetical protein